MAWRETLLVTGLALVLLMQGASCLVPRKVLVVGLDGGDWRYLQPLIDGGYVPAIADFQTNAAWGGLDCVPANPSFACYSPMVWNSIYTGWPSAVHGMNAPSTPPASRAVPAIWTQLQAYYPARTSALALARNTWPPIGDATWVITEPGALLLGEAHFYEMCPDGSQAAENQMPGSSSMPETWTDPPDLYASLGLIPTTEPQADSWIMPAVDRTAQRGLLALLGSLSAPPELTLFTLNNIDTAMHVTCGAVTQDFYGDVDAAALQAQAAAYTGPVHVCPEGYGNTGTAYREADEQLAAVLATHTWDYVLITSDHGMTYYPPGEAGLPCHHTAAPALDSATFGLRGPGVKTGPLPVTDVLCMAPLMAYVLGFPIAQDLPCVASGDFDTLLTAVFEPAHLSSNPPFYTPSW